MVVIKRVWESPYAFTQGRFQHTEQSITNKASNRGFKFLLLLDVGRDLVFLLFHHILTMTDLKNNNKLVEQTVVVLIQSRINYISKPRVTHVFLCFLYLSSELRLLCFQFSCAFQLLVKLKQRKQLMIRSNYQRWSLLKKKHLLSFIYGLFQIQASPTCSLITWFSFCAVSKSISSLLALSS